MTYVIPQEAIQSRKNWIEKIARFSKSSDSDNGFIEGDLSEEINQKGYTGLLNHLRLCGHIPESYEQGAKEEKLYAKYTDGVLSHSYRAMGLKSLTQSKASKVSSVEGYADNYEFIAGARAFRLSRVAKNQKDYRLHTMDQLKYGKPYAMVVCPIYQLPNRSSLIYRDAIMRNVCLFTYSHLSLLVRYSDEISQEKAKELLHLVFKTILVLHPSKNAVDYWLGVNKAMLGYSKEVCELWRDEKFAAVHSIGIAKDEALHYFASERSRIMRLSHEDALMQLIQASKIDQKIKIVKQVSDNGLFSVR